MTRVAVAVKGWNAEAAIGLALAARRYASAVTLSTEGEKANGKDDVEVLTLGPEPGEEVVLAVDGPDEKEAFDALLAKLLSVIEPAKDRIETVLGLAAADKEKAAKPRRRVAEVAALDVEEVAPAEPFRRRVPDVVTLGARGRKPTRRKQRANRKPTKKPGRGPRKRKK